MKARLSMEAEADVFERFAMFPPTLVQSWYSSFLGCMEDSSECRVSFSELVEKIAVDRFFAFPDLFLQVLGQRIGYQVVLCPFHEDRHHPSAKVFGGEMGDTLYCFAERKVFYPHHMVKRYVAADWDKYVFRALRGVQVSRLSDYFSQVFGLGEERGGKTGRYYSVDGSLLDFKRSAGSFREFQKGLMKVK